MMWVPQILSLDFQRVGQSILMYDGILLHRQHPVLEAGYGTRVLTSFTG